MKRYQYRIGVMELVGTVILVLIFIYWFTKFYGLAEQWKALQAQAITIAKTGLMK